MIVWLLLLVVLLVTGPLLTLAFGRVSLHGDWRSATHRSAGLAPDAVSHREAIVQVYASRTFGWRGAFSDHTWLAAKPAGAEHYLRYEVIGWYGGGGRSVVSVSDRQAPDAGFPRPSRPIRSPPLITRGPDRTAIRSSRTSVAKFRSCTWPCRPPP